MKSLVKAVVCCDGLLGRDTLDIYTATVNMNSGDLPETNNPDGGVGLVSRLPLSFEGKIEANSLTCWTKAATRQVGSSATSASWLQGSVSSWYNECEVRLVLADQRRVVVVVKIMVK
jgi:hypothetical protein